MGTYQINRHSETFYLEKIGETEFAIKFTDGISTVWVPRSVIIDMEEVKKPDYEVELPLWFAKKKEMI